MNADYSNNVKLSSKSHGYLNLKESYFYYQHQIFF